ncbi:unnamed protein product [Pipistrellus nathusii]|uniref:Uncharacterized protein n=1 Tax=Pipistrellus nathusii TaxID=59473 RepID=A0ABP0AGA1_PIPNA
MRQLPGRSIGPCSAKHAVARERPPQLRSPAEPDRAWPARRASPQPSERDDGPERPPLIPQPRRRHR